MYHLHVRGHRLKMPHDNGRHLLHTTTPSPLLNGTTITIAVASACAVLKSDRFHHRLSTTAAKSSVRSETGRCPRQLTDPGMQRPPASGGQAGLVAAVEPTTAERLDRVGKLLAEKKPWPTFLQIPARATEEWEACPTPVQEALAWMVTATVGVLDSASVGPLVPVCQAFKALIEAAEGAAESQDKLKSLISRCAFLTTVFIQHHRAVGPLAQVQKPMKAFIVATNDLAAFALRWAKGGKRRAFVYHRTDLKTLADFEEGLRGITNDIALVNGMEHHQLLLAVHRHLHPPTLPDMAAVPRGAISLTDAHVSRPSLLGSAIGYLTNTARGDAPCVLTGMAGGGKSVLASAVVRDEKVREHFSAGIFWWRVGCDAKDQLHDWLEGLVLRVASSSGTTPPVLGSVEEVTRYLKAFCADGVSPRLVVLDDVWEREVVDALQLTGLQLLVTTRDRSVVSMPGECVEVGDMEEDEALEVLRVGCGAPKNLELPRLEALQVVGDCGKLPLSLGLAAPLLKGPPQEPKSWRTLHEALHKAMTTRLGTDRIMTVPERVDAVLEVSLGVMADDPAERKRCLFLGVLAPGAMAPSDMLVHLWDEAPGAAKMFASQLVDQSMLQPAGDAFRVHDLVLRFLKPKLKADPNRSIATSRTAEYMGQPEVLRRYVNAGETSDGMYSLVALWRSVEDLGEDSQAAAVYASSLDGVTDGTLWERASRVLYLMGKYEEAGPLYDGTLQVLGATVGEGHLGYASALNNRSLLFSTQGKYDEARPLFVRATEILENVLGPLWLAATALINRAALLESQGKHAEAETLRELAKEIWEKILVPHLPTLGTFLNNGAVLFANQGIYSEAETLCERSQIIREKALGPEHPDVAQSLNHRAAFLANQGKYAEAEPLYERCQAIEEKALGPKHPRFAVSLINRAGLFERQGKYEEADSLYLRGLGILGATVGEEHPHYASALSGRAGVLRVQGKYAEADPLYLRAIEVGEKTLGPDHPEVGARLNNRAVILSIQGKYSEAEPLYKQSHAIRVKVLGPEHPDVAQSLNNLAALLQHQGKYSEAKPLYEQSHAIRERMLGPEHPDVAQSLNNLAALLQRQGKYAEAEPLCERAKEILEKTLGPEHTTLATVLSNRAEFLEREGKYAGAELIYARCQAMFEKALDSQHPYVAAALNNRAGSLESQGKYAEAEPLYEQAIKIWETVHGREHPLVAAGLNNQAWLLESKGEYAEADLLYLRAIEIGEKTLGPDHPTVAKRLNNRAMLLCTQGKHAEAQPSCERALAIREGALGVDHPDTITSRVCVAYLYTRQGLLDKASPQLEEVVCSLDRASGSNHASKAAVLLHWALRFVKQEKPTKAIPLLESVLSIRAKMLGGSDPRTSTAQSNLNNTPKQVGRRGGRSSLRQHSLQMP